MAWHAALCGMTSISFYQDTSKPKSTGFFETIITLNLLDKNSNNSRNDMKFQIKNKKNRSIKFMGLLIPTLNKFISYQFLHILLDGVHHEQSSQKYVKFFIKKTFSQKKDG